MKHTVLDLTIPPEGGQEVFSGTLDECWEFIEFTGGLPSQYKVVPGYYAESCEPEPTTESLDEIADKYAAIALKYNETPAFYSEAYKAGYKKAAERLYSEDEIKALLHKMYLELRIAERTRLHYALMEEWFDENF